MNFLFFCFVSIPPPYKPGRYTSNYGKGRYIVGYHGAGAHNTSFADGDTGQQYGTCTDIGPRLHVDWTYFEIGFDNWPINRETCMSRAQHLGSGTPPHMVFQHEMPRIKIRLWPNPHVITNLRVSIKTALNISLISNKNTISNLESFQVFKSNTTADPDTVAEGPCQSSPNSSAHQILQLAIAIGESDIVFQESSSGIACSQMS